MNTLSVYRTDIEELLLKEGMEKGIEKGEWIGKIVLLESLMGLMSSSRKDLERQSVTALKRLFRTLEKASVIPPQQKIGLASSVKAS